MRTKSTKSTKTASKNATKAAQAKTTKQAPSRPELLQPAEGKLPVPFPAVWVQTLNRARLSMRPNQQAALELLLECAFEDYTMEGMLSDSVGYVLNMRGEIISERWLDSVLGRKPTAKGFGEELPKVAHLWLPADAVRRLEACARMIAVCDDDLPLLIPALANLWLGTFVNVLTDRQGGMFKTLFGSQGGEIAEWIEGLTDKGNLSAPIWGYVERLAMPAA